jgi:hypothetical protein
LIPVRKRKFAELLVGLSPHPATGRHDIPLAPVTALLICQHAETRSTCRRSSEIYSPTNDIGFVIVGRTQEFRWLSEFLQERLEFISVGRPSLIFLIESNVGHPNFHEVFLGGRVLDGRGR